MIPLSDVDWTPIDADEADNEFLEKWFESGDIKMCLRDNIWIVSGEKGSGKSAMKRALVEKYGKEYSTIHCIEFDSLAFRPIYNNIVKIARDTELSRTTLLSNIWRYCLIFEIGRNLSEKFPSLYERIFREFPQRLPEDATINAGLLSLTASLWNMIDDFTDPDAASSKTKRRPNLLSSGGLTAELIEKMKNFPTDDFFENIKNRLYGIMDEHGHRVMLMLDGFDILRTESAKDRESEIDSQDSIQLIFATLVTSVQTLRMDRGRSSGLCVKAFIPHDRFVNLELRDSDKMSAYHAPIKWTPRTLRDFVHKRVRATSDLTGAHFENVWHEIMPPKVHNTQYEVDEESFEYILRHTFWRPRQIQIYLMRLSALCHDEVIQANTIPDSISETSKEIAKFFVDEYCLNFPYLEKLIRSFKGRYNVQNYKEFRNHIHSFLNRERGELSGYDVDDIMNSFYKIGLFGIVDFLDKDTPKRESYYPPRKGKQAHFVAFGYKKYEVNVAATLTDEDLVALHPCFVDYANLKAHPEIIVG